MRPTMENITSKASIARVNQISNLRNFSINPTYISVAGRNYRPARDYVIKVVI